MNNNNNTNNTTNQIPTDCYDNTQQNVINGYMKELLTEALNDERADFKYYTRLANMGISDEDNKIIYSIALDEEKHYEMLKQIYKEIFGEDFTGSTVMHRELLDTPALNFERAVFSELEEAEFYRLIMFSFLSTRIRDMMFEIITDEQAHAQKFSYLYSKYN